jgi:quinol monooxygenase YgiN
MMVGKPGLERAAFAKGEAMGTEHEVVIIAEATALPGRRDDLKRAFDRLVPRSRAEEGISTFRLHEDRDRPGHFVLYERFRDQAAIDTHITLEHFAQILRDFAELAEGGKPKLSYFHILTE